MNSLSIIVITHNEAKNIVPCLQTVSWADEIIVVDSGSDDDTRSLARQFTDHVYHHGDWQGFGAQKNRALAYASKDWVLSIDADERVSDDLKREIQSILRDSYAVEVSSLTSMVYAIPRLSAYCGRFMYHGGWYPDYVPRLFRHGYAQFSDAPVHERLLFTGQAKRLRSHLLHYSYRDLDQVLEKTNAYSRAGAERLYSQGKKSSLGKAIGRGLWAFFRSYILRRGFLDGREGFILAVSNAEGTYYRYLKLMYLQIKKQEHSGA